MPAAQTPSHAFTFVALGTQWAVETSAPLDSSLQQSILARVQAFDATYSRFRPDSLVGQMALSGGRFEFPAEASRLFDLYDQLHTLTGGAVDPLVGADLERLGYDRDYTLVPVPEQSTGPRPTWQQDVQREGPLLLTQRPLKLDFGAAGKGLLVDSLSELLLTAGHHEFLVDGSGDLRHAGESGLDVGLEHPFKPERVIGVTSLQNRALCASAVNRRAWGTGLHHVLDARHGEPTRDVVATWVLAPDAMTADGLATALFFTRPETLSGAFAFCCVRMDARGYAEPSLNFDGELFTIQETT